MARRQFKDGGGFKHRKSLGQNFLTESWPCHKIVAIMSQADIQHVLEIGPGHGALTKQLLDKKFRVTAVEKDLRCVEKLNDLFGSNPAFKVIHADVTDYDLPGWLKSVGHGRAAVCGNIPYNMSSAILHWVLPSLSSLQLVNFMVQLEFAERLAAQPGSKSYGSLSVFVQLQSRVRLDFKIDRSAFFPIPGVDSAVFTLLPTVESYGRAVISQVEQVTRKVFSQRRKQLGNSLGTLVHEGNRDRVAIDLTRRCETLSPREFVELASALSS